MKITYECKFCGFCSQNKEEVQRCEAQGVKSKFSVGEEVEYIYDILDGKEQWGRATVDSVLFKERTHEIHCYVIRPKNEVAFTLPWPTAFSKHKKTIICYARQVQEKELRPLSVEQRS